MTHEMPLVRPASYDRKVGLVLQGGGALGSYQAGVYEALVASEYLPDWVAGISVGAINAAIIAGNVPGHRVQSLRSFWEAITAPTMLWPPAPAGLPAEWQHRASALSALMFGQRSFFTPRRPQDWFSLDKCVSYYETSVLKRTLERLVDFDRINDTKDMRLSVGAVNVRTGHFAYFDSEEITIRPEHIMASGALPPGFPPVEIDGEQYWDGGLLSNTPLQYMVDYYPRRSRLVFQVDLFPAHGRVLLPADLANTEQAKRLYEHGCVTQMDIVQLIYRPIEPQGAFKDFEFSRSTMEARWQQGFSDARSNLHASPWLAPMPRELGVRVFDVIHDILVGDRGPAD